MRLIAPDVHLLDQFPPNLINVYLIEDVLIDSGARAARRRIFRQIEGRRLSAHALTHAHPDHQGASKAVCEAFQVPLCCGAGDVEAMELGRTAEGLNLPRWMREAIEKTLSGPPHPVSRRLREGDEVAGFRVIETPGHSPGHVSYFRDRDRVLIVGDVLSNVDLKTGLPGLHEPQRVFTRDPELNRASARKLAELEPAVICFGHGPPLRDTRKFLEYIRRLPNSAARDVNPQPKVQAP